MLFRIIAMDNHEILGGRVQLFRRDNSKYWQCSCSVGKRQFRVSSKEERLASAKSFAEDWYFGLLGEERTGTLPKKNEPREITFADAAEQFMLEYETITDGERSKKWIEGYEIRLRLHILPFFGNIPVSQVTEGRVQDYRVIRATQAGRQPKNAPKGYVKPPSRSTIHDEIVAIRQVLKTAARHGWLKHVPNLTPPYKSQGKITHRAWFSPNEYKELYRATREHAKTITDRYKWNAEQLHDFVLFMGNTGLRPDEAKLLQHRDVSIVKDGATGERILEIEVRGKRGIGYCKSMPGAVRVYERMLTRPKPGPHIRLRKGQEPPPANLPKRTDLLFPGSNLKMFNQVLDKAGLKYDRDGQPRTSYSLRHTYICLRLMEGADIYQVAKNCRTSVEMIEKFYAAHIKNTLDASAINVRKPTRLRDKYEVHDEDDEY